MININLLPWREEQLATKNKIFGIIATVVFVCCFSFAFVIKLFVIGFLESEEKAVSVLKKEITMIEDKIITIKDLQKEQDLLLKKRDIIQELQASRPFIVNLFEDIVKAVPDGLFLTYIKRAGNTLTLDGISSSNSRISVFMRNLEKLKVFSNAVLQEIKTGDAKDDKGAVKSKQVKFQLKCELVY